MVKTYVFLRQLFFALLFLICEESYSQRFRFGHLDVATGLPGSYVKNVIQDNSGFMWFATDNGLARYDGYSFVYYLNSEKKNTISSNNINKIYIDSTNIIWLATMAGLDKYIPEKDEFIRIEEFSSLTKNKTVAVNDVLQLSTNEYLVTTSMGLIKLVFQKNGQYTIKKYRYLDEDLEFKRFYVGKGSKIWIGSENGLFYFNNHKDTLVKYPVKYEFSGNAQTFNITAILEDIKGNLLITTYFNGLLYVDLSNGDVKQYTSNSDQPHSVSNDMLHYIFRDKNDRIWICSDNGLNLLLGEEKGKENFSFQKIYHLESDPASIGSNIVINGYCDDRGWLWFGSYYSGVSILSENRYKMEHFKYIPDSASSPLGKIVTSFAEDKKGYIWISTDGGGISRFDPSNNSFKNFSIKEIGKDVNIGKALVVKYDQKRSKIWMATWGSGLNCYDLKESKFYNVNLSGAGPSTKHYTSLHLMKNGDLLLGTLNEGLICYSPESKKIKKYPVFSNKKPDFQNSNRIVDINEDPDGTIWICSEFEGIFVYDPEKDTLTTEHRLFNLKETLSSRYVFSVFRDQKGNYWISTDNGLYFFNITDHKIYLYNSSNGLPANEIYSAVEDHLGKVWLTSRRGLIRCDPKLSDGFPDFKFSVFGMNDGVQNLQFNKRAVLRSSDNKLYFGGINGFNIIDPELINNKYDPVKLYINSLLLFNQSVYPGENSVLKKHISLTDSVILKYSQNFFTLNFSTISFDSPEKISFSYKLEDVDKEWQHAGPIRFANYTNIDPGSYMFKLQAFRDEEPVSEILELTIIIVPAWWQLISVRIAFVLALVALVVYFIYYRFKLVRKQRDRLSAAVKEQTSELSKLLFKLKEQSEEIQVQNEELLSQNNELFHQREEIQHMNEELRVAQENLKVINVDLEKRVKERTTNLLKANQELDRFVYSASHDLAAPLKSILGLVNVSRLEVKEGKILEYLDHMETSVKRLDDVIYNLTQFSRNMGWEVKKDTVSLSKLLQEISAELSWLIVDGNIDFRMDIDDSLVVHTDFYRLKIIIQNLLANAFKYYDPCKAQRSVEISCIRTEETIEIFIKDNGIGIAGKEQSKVFKMFYRGTTLSKGSGLGMYIVKEMIAKLNGKIELESQLGVGTTVKFSIPK